MWNSVPRRWRVIAVEYTQHTHSYTYKVMHLNHVSSFGFGGCENEPKDAFRSSWIYMEILLGKLLLPSECVFMYHIDVLWFRFILALAGNSNVVWILWCSLQVSRSLSVSLIVMMCLEEMFAVYTLREVFMWMSFVHINYIMLLWKSILALLFWYVLFFNYRMFFEEQKNQVVQM